MAGREVNGLTKKALSVIKNPIKFIGRLKIRNKDGKLVYLVPNSEQIEIIKSLEKDKGTLILKPRQIGSTTIIAAYLFWLWYSTEEPITIALLSHKLESSKQILKMWKTFYYNLPSFLQKPLSEENTTKMKLRGTGAEVMAVSAKGSGGLRSFTANYLHISEYAFADNPEELKATAIGALNNGKLIIESTANFFNDALHKEILQWEKGEGDWDFLFFPWYQHDEYRRQGSRHGEYTKEEKVLLNTLSKSQVCWRRRMIARLGEDKFKREYPATIEEAYTQGRDSYFTSRDLENTTVLFTSFKDAEPVFFADPVKSDIYGIGVDVAAGVNRDYTVITVLSKTTYQPVAIWRSNKTSIIKAAEQLVAMAMRYGKAKILIESNNHGNAMLSEVRHLNYTNIWKDKDNKDWSTNVKTKVILFEELKEALNQGVIRDLDQVTYSELRSYGINEKGNIEYPSNMESHGDSVIALGLALQCIKTISMPKNEYLPDRIKKMRAKTLAKTQSYNDLRRY